MAKQHKSPKPGKVDEQIKAEEQSFNNPFNALGKDLKLNGQAESGKKPAAPKIATKTAPARPAADSPSAAEADDSDAALFLNAVSSSSFKPLHKEPEAALPNPVLPIKNSEQSKRVSSEKTMEPVKSNYSAATADVPAGYAERDPVAKLAALEDMSSSPGFDDEETSFFARAMQGVAPVNTRGRETPLEPVRSAQTEVQRKLMAEQNRAYLEEFLQGKVEFALEYTEEFYEGHVMGLDPLVLSKLRAGQYSPETHVDLHGQNAEQAYATLIDFIRRSYNKGQRSVVVVTGRGKNSPGGQSVLRQNMQNWLTRDPLKRVVLAFCTAQPKDGGAGAIYVLLRKFKKSTGKIRWELMAAMGPVL